MRMIAKGLYEAWNRFLPAYPEGTVPDDAVMPYITYEVKQPNWRDQTTYNVRVWYKDTSFQNITEKVDEIAEWVGEGKLLTIQNGYIWLFKDVNFCQFQPLTEDEREYKCAYLSFIIHALV